MQRVQSAPRAVLTVAAATLLVAACTASGPPPAATPAAPSSSTTSHGGTSTATTSTASTSSTSSTASTASTATGQPTSAAALPALLQFTATTVDGKPFDGAALQGRKTVLWFWAPWCTVCARNAGSVRSAATALGPAVKVIGVAGLSSSADDMRGFVQRGGLQTITNLADTTGDLYSRFGVTQQDTYVFVSPDGSAKTVNGYSSTVDIVGLAGKTFG
jgi:peroxiredoxin